MMWYFGTSTPPLKISSNQSATWYDLGTLNPGTKYYWKIVAWDEHGASTAGTLWDFTTNSPPNVPLINGPTSGNAGETYTYTFVAIDPDDDNIYYEINWGDGTVDDWYGPCNQMSLSQEIIPGLKKVRIQSRREQRMSMMPLENGER